MYLVSHTSPSIHRLIMNPSDGNVVDHINKNGLDNRKQNLREVKKYINNRNTNKRADNKSGVIGIHLTRGINWTAKWYDSNHKMCTKSFSCKKYGYDKAKQMAIDYRLSRMKENEYMYDKEMYGESSETIEST